MGGGEMKNQRPMDKVLIRTSRGSMIWLCPSGIGIQVRGGKYHALTGERVQKLARRWVGERKEQEESK